MIGQRFNNEERPAEALRSGTRRASIVIAAAIVTFAVPSPGAGADAGSSKSKVEKNMAPSTTDDFVRIKGPNTNISRTPPLRGEYTYVSAIYAQPQALIRKRDGLLISLTLLVNAETFTDPAVGRERCLGVLKNIAFILNGKDFATFPIENAAIGLDEQASYDLTTLSWWNVISEKGSVPITREDLHSLAHTPGVAVKLTGSERSVVLNQRDVARNFITNLRAFETALVAEEGNLLGTVKS